MKIKIEMTIKSYTY